MTEYGVWTENDGGFVSTQCYSVAEAQAEIDRLVRDETDPTDRDSARADLSVVEVCADHEEQAADSCEECFAEEDEDSDDENDEDDLAA